MGDVHTSGAKVQCGKSVCAWGVKSTCRVAQQRRRMCIYVCRVSVGTRMCAWSEVPQQSHMPLCQAKLNSSGCAVCAASAQCLTCHSSLERNSCIQELLGLKCQESGSQCSAGARNTLETIRAFMHLHKLSGSVSRGQQQSAQLNTHRSRLASWQEGANCVLLSMGRGGVMLAVLHRFKQRSAGRCFGSMINIWEHTGRPCKVLCDDSMCCTHNRPTVPRGTSRDLTTRMVSHRQT